MAAPSGPNNRPFSKAGVWVRVLAARLRGLYTRKSSEEGLDMEFNSLDAQREACEAYIASQRGEGWVQVADRYDDGGVSGGTLDRPAVKRLLTDIQAGKIDIVVVYKVDRLSRSLLDFHKLIELFERHQTTFVSITQSFNTTDAMGRMHLNIMLTFAQYEREVIGERIRDKVAASRKKGMWMGGWTPMGYEVRDRKLIIREADAVRVRSIFKRFVQLKSATLLAGSWSRRAPPTATATCSIRECSISSSTTGFTLAKPRTRASPTQESTRPLSTASSGIRPMPFSRRSHSAVCGSLHAGRCRPSALLRRGHGSSGDVRCEEASCSAGVTLEAKEHQAIPLGAGDLAGDRGQRLVRPAQILEVVRAHRDAVLDPPGIAVRFRVYRLAGFRARHAVGPVQPSPV
jgi:DNA invertase Pin-like site-specific DNA recombinase